MTLILLASAYMSAASMLRIYLVSHCSKLFSRLSICFDVARSVQFTAGSFSFQMICVKIFLKLITK